MLESQKETFAARGARVVSVNLDEPARATAIRSYAKQEGFTFRIVMNKTEEKPYHIDKAYLVKGTPTSYLIDAGGSIVNAHFGGVLSMAEMKAALDKLPAD